jgi:hypothetical protein
MLNIALDKLAPLAAPVAVSPAAAATAPTTK